MSKRHVFKWLFAWLIGVALNFGIFLVSYKFLTFPYLHEEQRVENAPYIFSYVLPAVMLATLITILVFYYSSKKKWGE